MDCNKERKDKRRKAENVVVVSAIKNISQLGRKTTKCESIEKKLQSKIIFFNITSLPVVDEAGFTELVKEAYPHDDIPARSRIRNNIMYYYLVFYITNSIYFICTRMLTQCH